MDAPGKDDTVDAQRRPSVRAVLASLALCMLLPSLGNSIANVALPTLAGAFGATFREVQWVVLAYLLVTTAAVIGVGRLGDVLGRRRVLMAGIVLFTAASALCSVAPTLGWLLVARSVQGLGAAAMMALTMAFVGEAVPKARTGSAMGLLGTLSAVGTALGPPLGGVLVAGFGWPAIFAVNVPLGVLALALVRRSLPADRPAAKISQGADPAGTLLLAATLVAYALAMTTGRGGFGAVNAALLAGAVIGLGCFVFVETRAASPLIPLPTLRDPALASSLGASALVSTVVMATLVVGPFYLARALGLDILTVGIVMSAGPVIAALAGVPAGRAVDRFGARPMALSGLVGMGVGCAALSMSPRWLGIAGYVLPMIVATAGYAWFQAANNSAVMADVAADRRGVVSGMLGMARNLGLITGASVLGAVFAIAAAAGDVTTAGPEAVAHGMRVTFAVAAALVVVALVIARAGRAAPGSLSEGARRRFA